MKPSRQDVEGMVAGLMTVLHSTERARRKGDASRLATLSIIAARPESSPKAISEELGFHPSSITRQVQALERDGHVKVTVDSADERSCRVKVTVAGRTELARLKKMGLQRFSAFVATWEADEVRALSRLLWKLEQSKNEFGAHAKSSDRSWRQSQKKK